MQSPPPPSVHAKPLSLGQVLLYGLGSLTALAWIGTNSLSLNILNIVLGVDAALITSAMAIVQITGIFLDPIIANFSDNFVTRWGRRRPLIIIGSIIAGISFAVLWLFPTGWSGHQYFIWYLVLSLVMNLGKSVYGAGYFSLGIEIATDYRDRTRIMAIRSYFSKATTIVGPWLFFIVQLGIFSSAIEGVRWVGALIGAVIIAGAVPCGIWTRERFADLVKIEQAPLQSPLQPVVDFFKTICSIGGNRYFWMLLGVSVTLSSGLAIFEQIGNYVNFFYVFRGDTKMGAQFAGWSNTLGVILAIGAIPLAQWLCNRFGKHVALRMALVWMLLGSILKWFCYTPGYPYLILLIPIFYSVGISSFWMVVPSMQADVVDIDELRSGRRREAMFGAVTSLGFRASSAIALGLTGFVLNATGFDRSLGGEQAPGTFFWMRLLFSFAMAGVVLLSLLFLIKYDLTEKRMEEVRVELEKRRAQILQ